MTIAALDSAYPPSATQVAAAKAAGYSGWNGYFAGRNILHGWSDADFSTVLDGGLGTLAFCSGWADPTAMKIRGEALGIPIMLDCEGGIRGDGPWLQPWLDVSGGGLYANYWVFPGKRASRYMLCAYPTSGDPTNVSWNTGYIARPAGLCGWQWAGSHNEFGVTVDSEWLDDTFYGLHGPGKGTIGGTKRKMLVTVDSNGTEYWWTGEALLTLTEASDGAKLIAAGIPAAGQFARGQGLSDSLIEKLKALTETGGGGAVSSPKGVSGTFTGTVTGGL